MLRNEAATSDGGGDDDGVVAAVQLPVAVGPALVDRDEPAAAPDNKMGKNLSTLFYYSVRVLVNALTYKTQKLGL